MVIAVAMAAIAMHFYDIGVSVLTNITPADMAGLLPNSTYAPNMVNNITMFSGVLENEGYLESSTSSFQLNKTTVKAPTLITSSVFMMSNATAAKEALGTLLLSNNANQSITGFYYNNTYASNASVGENRVHIYTVYSVAVFNTTLPIIEKLNNTGSNANENMPDFQYTTLFAYRNMIGTVVVNSYNNSNTYRNISVAAAELLIKKLSSPV